AAVPGNAFAAVDRVALVVSLKEGFVAGLLDMARYFAVRLAPLNVFPVVRTRTPHLRLQQPPLIQNVMVKGSAFGAERAAVDWVIRIAFNVDHLWGDVFGLVAQRVDDHAAAYRAVRTDAVGFGGARNLETT